MTRLLPSRAQELTRHQTPSALPNRGFKSGLAAALWFARWAWHGILAAQVVNRYRNGLLLGSWQIGKAGRVIPAFCPNIGNFPLFHGRSSAYVVL